MAVAKVASALGLQRQEGVAYALSYGIGVDSTAMVILALKYGLPIDYVVAADPGDEMPETYAYLEYIRPILERMGVKLVVVHPKNGRGLGQRCRERRVIPSTHWRWCTRDTKIRPIHAFYRTLKQPIVQYIGFDKGEGSRIKKTLKRKDDPHLDITNVYPLHDFGLDRDACVSMIEQARLTVPIKSSCTFCPYKSTEQWIFLYHNHKPEFYAAMEMEERNKYFPKQRLFIIPLREFEKLILAGKPLPKSKYSDNCGSL